MDGTLTVHSPVTADAFAVLIGRLRLTQAEIARLLGDGSPAGDEILPGGGIEGARAVTIATALAEALELVGDDALVGAWLRAGLARRGGASPLDEVASVDDDRLVRFVLRPHPTELVRLVADRAVAGFRA